MLADPKNPGLWLDGQTRSQNNGFTNGYGAALNWAGLQRYADARQRSTDQVNQAPHGSRSVRALTVKQRK